MKGKDLLVALFALGIVLLSWPLLTAVNHPRALFGIPLLVLYLFVVWAGIIGAVCWVVRRAETGDSPSDDRPPGSRP
jgi:membrane protein implicated in regulation of membrane protease activity